MKPQSKPPALHLFRSLGHLISLSFLKGRRHFQLWQAFSHLDTALGQLRKPQIKHTHYSLTPSRAAQGGPREAQPLSSLSHAKKFSIEAVFFPGWKSEPAFESKYYPRAGGRMGWKQRLQYPSCLNVEQGRRREHPHPFPLLHVKRGNTLGTGLSHQDSL